MADTDSNYGIRFLGGIPVVGRVTYRSKRWVEDHPDWVAVALTALLAYGTYRGLKWAYKRWVGTSLNRSMVGTQPMGDFAEEDVDGESFGLPELEDTTPKSRRQKVPVVQDAEPRNVEVESQVAEGDEDFGSEVVADDYEYADVGGGDADYDV